MRIHGSNDYAPKADVQRTDRATNEVKKSPQLRSTTDVSAQRPDEGAPAEGAKKTGGDAVVLSATASRYAEVSSEHSAEVEARLAEVKKMLDAGTYEVDFDRLADNLLGEEIERSRS